MDHRSGSRQRLWEAMESCRSGSDDMGDPRFADLAARLAEDPEFRGQFQRLQEADDAIRVAFAKVSVPAGLADRISRHLAELAAMADSGSQPAASVPLAATSSPEAPAVVVPAMTVTPMAVTPMAVTPMTVTPITMRDGPTPRRAPTQRLSRRRLLVGFGGLSAAAALFAAVWIQTHLRRPETPNSVLVKAVDFFGEDNHPGEFSPAAPPAEYPVSRDIARIREIRWRNVDNFLGGRAVAYDLSTNGGRAALYVTQMNIPGLPSMAPDSPSFSTGGRSAAAWQAGDLLYVLVVEGDAGTYSSYLDQSHGPLT